MTRKPSPSNFFIPRVLKNAGQKKLGYRGVDLWNSLVEIKKLNFVQKKLQKKSFTTLLNYLDHSIIENQNEN